MSSGLNTASAVPLMSKRGAAAATLDPIAAQTYRDIARQWLELAKRAEDGGAVIRNAQRERRRPTVAAITSKIKPVQSGITNARC